MNIEETQLIQEERLSGEFDIPYSLSSPYECPHANSANANANSDLTLNQKHRQHIEWLREIRLSLLPLLVSCAIFILLIRIVFLVHDVENLIKFLQIVVSLFGATASGYAYAQIRAPQNNLIKSDTPPNKTTEP